MTSSNTWSFSDSHEPCTHHDNCGDMRQANGTEIPIKVREQRQNETNTVFDPPEDMIDIHEEPSFDASGTYASTGETDVLIEDSSDAETEVEEMPEWSDLNPSPSASPVAVDAFEKLTNLLNSLPKGKKPNVTYRHSRPPMRKESGKEVGPQLPERERDVGIGIGPVPRGGWGWLDVGSEASRRVVWGVGPNVKK